MGIESKGYEALAIMIKKASDISIQEKVKTFFDISGYPHYENVISNIVAFFFDVNEEHGLKDLWIKSLLECYNKNAQTDIQLGEFEKIEREYTTEENKRLDLIILLNNAIVAIENKIYAKTSNNPFKEYHKEVLEYKKELENKSDVKIVEIILSLKHVGKHITENGAVFHNITYKTLISKVKENLGDYILKANEKWLIFMKELLNNLENLGEMDIMDIKWQEFLKENEGNIKCFFDNYRKDLDSKMRYLNNLFDILDQEIKADDKLRLSITKKGVYGTKAGGFRGYFSLYIDILKNEETIVLEPYVSRQKPSDLVIELWNRDKKKNDWSKEIDLFKVDFPEAKEVDEAGWKRCLELERMNFGKNIPLEDTANKLLGIMKRLIENIE